jgi:acetamidase/formamidase
LPIHHPGALFYLGDVHASQGDTEFTGTAAKTKATVQVKLDVIKSKKIPWMHADHNPAKLGRACQILRI